VPSKAPAKTSEDRGLVGEFLLPRVGPFLDIIPHRVVPEEATGNGKDLLVLLIPIMVFGWILVFPGAAQTAFGRLLNIPRQMDYYYSYTKWYIMKLPCCLSAEVDCDV
jgi:hypothetical protein